MQKRSFKYRENFLCGAEFIRRDLFYVTFFFENVTCNISKYIFMIF